MREPFWDESTVAYAAWLWYRRHRTWPTQVDWRTSGDEHPSAVTAKKVFGVWSELIKAGGKIESDVKRKVEVRG